MAKEVVVLRYGHRVVRDYRVTSHCCLVARAFGADKIVVCGDEDATIKQSVDDIVKRWGGNFSVEFCKSWRHALSCYKRQGYRVVHLTMYGLPLQKQAKEFRKAERLLLIIGSQKVERAVYEESDMNIAVSGQPHSEIAALAVALDWFFRGRELSKKFGGANICVVPQARGKKVAKSKK